MLKKVMPRQARLDYPGAYHHVMGRGIDGLHIFDEKFDKQDFLARIRKLQKKSNMQIYAWCVMSNHFHLLYQTGKTSLAEFMRGLLTGFAINYNRRYKRRGHLFQNRYKSIVVDADEYFLPLVRYIHLNPVKAELISLNKLEEYRWCGNREIIKKENEGIIDRDKVLGFFGQKEKSALKEYERYVKEGLEKDEDYLMGGGLIRSLSGRQGVVEGRIDEREMSDERILGEGIFVEEVLEICEEKEDNLFKGVDDLLKKVSRLYKIAKEKMIETKSRDVRVARSVFIYLAVKHLGMSVKEAGRILRIQNAAASMALKRGMEIERENGVVKKLIEQIE